MGCIPYSLTVAGRREWILAAREALIRHGSDGIQMDRLAQQLGTATSTFYAHFKNRDQLLDELIATWQAENSFAMECAALSWTSAERRFDAFWDAWAEGSSYLADFDAAVREWARTSERASSAVRMIDDRRVELLRLIFTDLGYTERAALVSARITYCFQVGYAATGQLGHDEIDQASVTPVYREALRDGIGRFLDR